MELIQPTSVDKFRYKFYKVCTSNGGEVHFQSEAEFLEYMNQRSFSVSSRDKGEYNTKFVLKKE